MNRVCKHFLIPVQSGSDQMLLRMRRGYTLSEFYERVAYIKKVIPDVAISTDIIVGFPGESEKEFQDTVKLVKEIKFDKIHIAAYSPRPGTFAYRKMNDDIPIEIKKERLQIIESIQKDIAINKNMELINTSVDVLVEKEDIGKCSGRTEKNQLVHFKGNNLIGEIVKVKIYEVSPWSLKGVLHQSKEFAIL